MRDSILYSFHFTWDSIVKFFTEQPLLFFIIGILILWSIIAQIIKARLRKKYISPYENRLNTENKEFYIKYYKKVHSLNVFGVILVLTLVITYILTKNQVIGTVLAV